MDAAASGFVSKESNRSSMEAPNSSSMILFTSLYSKGGT